MTDYVRKWVLNGNRILFIGFVAKILVSSSNSSPKVLCSSGEKVVVGTVPLCDRVVKASGSTRRLIPHSSAPAITIVDVTTQTPPSFAASAPAPLIFGFNSTQSAPSTSSLTSSPGLSAIYGSHETFCSNFDSHGPPFDFNFEFQALAASSTGFAMPFDGLHEFVMVFETVSRVEFPNTWGPIDLNQLVAMSTSTPMVPVNEEPTLTGWEPTTLDELVASSLSAGPSTRTPPAHGFSGTPVLVTNGQLPIGMAFAEMVVHVILPMDSAAQHTLNRGVRAADNLNLYASGHEDWTHYILMAPRPTCAMSAEVGRGWPRGLDRVGRSPTSHRPTRSRPLGQPRPTSADIAQVGRGAIKM
ncbi:hypothetical protein B0H14DRAFT_2568506 [Mycena olivaceomarginata]|nr:hypothetical protein B0H14DRAFT_2568506 [Mycena olivaceomarginata]